MNIPYFFSELKGVSGAMNAKLSPGPFVVAVNESDALAAQILELVYGRFGDREVAEIEKALINALWWHKFWMAQVDHVEGQSGEKP